MTYEKFPDDLDTTSLGLVTMKPPKELVHSIMDEMLHCLSPDGLPYVRMHRSCDHELALTRSCRATSIQNFPVWTLLSP